MTKRNRLNPKSVALMCTSFKNMAGGLERQIIRTANIFSKNGYKVYLVSFDSIDDSSFYQIPREITWLKCGMNLSPHKAASFGQRFQQLLYLRKCIRESNISCLITFHHGLYLRSLVATLFTGVKNVVSERNSLKFYNYIKQRKYNFAYILSLFAHARTVQIDSYITEYPPIARRKIVTIPNILPAKSVNTKRPNLESRKVCLVGRLEAQKNFSLLLDQMQESIGDLNFNVEIAGDGSLMQEYNNKYSDLIAKGYLKLRGNIEEINHFMSSSSLLCFPSLWEGFPNALIEALYCGLPIVTSSRMRDLRSFIEHDINGLIVEDSRLFESIQYLVEEVEILDAYSKKSFEKYKLLAQHNPEQLWMNLIESLVR